MTQTTAAETNNFYQETVAQARKTNTDERGSARSGKRDTLQKRVTDFYNSFMNNWQSQVTSAAEKGLGKTNILVYNSSNDEGKNASFLMNGPRNIGLKFFTNQGIIPLFQRVRNEVESQGFRVYHWYAGKQRNVIEVTWLDSSRFASHENPNSLMHYNRNIDYSNLLGERPEEFRNARYTEFFINTVLTTQRFRTERRTQITERQSDLETEVSQLFTTITENWRERVSSAAAEGRNYVNLFQYDGNTDGGKRYSFVLRGPRNLGQRFFYQRGVTPLVSRLETFFGSEGFVVAHKYFGRPRKNEETALGNVIELRWM